MAIDINDILPQMLDAIKQEVKQDWKSVKNIAEGFLQNKKDRLAFLTALRLKNQITDADFKQRLKNEELILETELRAISVMTKVTAQNAANAAMSVLSKTIATALDIII